MAMPIIQPPHLHRGDLIRVISPSLPSLAYSRGSLDRAVARLASMGFRCDFSFNAFEISEDGRSAGSALQRAEDLHDAFSDPSVAGVLSAVGGLASHDLLPYLDPGLLRASPTAFIGRSDNTYLNAFLYAQAGITSFTGTTFVTHFGEYNVAPETEQSFQDVLLGQGEFRLITSPVRTQNSVPSTYTGTVHRWDHERPGKDVWLRPGRAEGRLLGAEAGILSDLIEGGLLDLEGSVLWIDIVDDGRKYADDVLSRLWGLLEGVRVAAILVADNPSMPFETWVSDIERRLIDGGLEVDGPVLVGGDLGHYQPAWLMPYGGVVAVDAESGVIIHR